MEQSVGRRTAVGSGRSCSTTCPGWSPDRRSTASSSSSPGLAAASTAARRRSWSAPSASTCPPRRPGGVGAAAARLGAGGGEDRITPGPARRTAACLGRRHRRARSRPRHRRARDRLRSRARRPSGWRPRARARRVEEPLPGAGRVAAGGRLRGRDRARGAFLYVSPQIEEMLGYTPEEWLRRPERVARAHPPRRGRGGARARGTSRMRESLERGRPDRRASTGWSTAPAARSGCATSPASAPGRRRLALLARGPDRHQRRAQRPARARRRPRAPPGHGRRDAGLLVSGRAPGDGPLAFRLGADRAAARLHAGGVVRRSDPWRASLHADDRERVELEEKHQMDQPAGTEFVTEYRLRHRSGRGRRRARPGDPHPRPEGEQMIEGILTDISAERAAEAVAEGSPTSTGSAAATAATAGRGAGRALPRCSSQNVDEVSLNSTLRDLAASRQQVEGLLDGIQKHLEALGTNLRSTITLSSRRAPPGSAAATVPVDGLQGPDLEGARRLGELAAPGRARRADRRRRRLRRLGHRRRLRRARDRPRLSPGAHRPGLRGGADLRLAAGRVRAAATSPCGCRAGRGIEAEEMLEPASGGTRRARRRRPRAGRRPRRCRGRG